MSPVLRFEDDNTKAINKERVKQQRVIPVGTLLYTSSVNLPSVLSQNTLLFTTDTRELYIGTGTGIARVNIGSDGEVIDKGDYLTKVEAAQFYVQKEYLDPSSVITERQMRDTIAPLSQQIRDLINENDLKADKENVYTKGESNSRFIDNDEFAEGMSKKVDQEILTATGNHPIIKNLSTGLMLKFQNIGNDVESYVNVGKNNIVLYSKRTKDEEFGGHLYITPNGVFYTYSNDESFGINDELVTMSDLASIQEMYSQVEDSCKEIREIALRSVESARNSELMVEETKKYTQNIALQSSDAFNRATEALDTANRIESQLLAAYNNSTSSLQKAISASETANSAKVESGETVIALTQFENAISGQFEELKRQVNMLISGNIPSDDGRKKIVSVENINEIYEVPYNTAASKLNLPTQVRVKLEDDTIRVVDVSWKLNAYQKLQTEYSQNIIGIITETGEIKNPDYRFALCTVRVLPNPETPGSENNGWEVVFAVPTMVDTVSNFNTAINHEELLSEDVMGTFDSFDNYVEPVVQLFFLGTLNVLDSSITGVRVLDAIERTTLINNTVMTYAPYGLKVPIYGVATEEEIRNYETQLMTLGFTNSNGTVIYSEGTLMFNNAIHANAVYAIRKAPSENTVIPQVDDLNDNEEIDQYSDPEY